MRSLGIIGAFYLIFVSTVSAQRADWPEPRHDRHLTAVQPAPGAIDKQPALIGEIDLGRVVPAATAVDRGNGRGSVWVAIIGGELRGYEADGQLAWKCHPTGINFTSISASGDSDGDGSGE